MARTIFFDDRDWMNYHLTVKGVPIAGRYELHNSPGTSSLEKMAASAAALQALIGKAFAERRRLRAQGSTWSFSEAPAVPGGWSLATGHARMIVTLAPTHLVPQYAGERDGLVLCQTGVPVSDLNQFLEANGRSLMTSGASNGQTFVGAMSTSTHGSAIDLPAIQGHVVGLQLIPGPDRNLWIEPASAPVTDGRMATALGATMLRDDRLFAAALVSLGGLGVIHSVLIRTVPRFLLVTHRDKVPLTAGILKAMNGGGFEDADLPGPDGRPYFFQSVVNRHIDSKNAYITAGYSSAWDPSHVLKYDRQNKRGPGYNLAVIIANLLEAAPGVTPVITKAVLADQLKPIPGVAASWGQSFNYNTPRAGQAGSATAVPAERTGEVLEIFERALKRAGPAPVAFACRYAVASPGLLAFQRFARTAIVDIDGLDSRSTRKVMAEAIGMLRAAGIPHAEHWGKLNQLTATSVRDAYGPDLETWMKARTDLLDREGEYVFGNAFLDRLGMTSAMF